MEVSNVGTEMESKEVAVDVQKENDVSEAKEATPLKIFTITEKEEDHIHPVLTYPIPLEESDLIC